MNQIMQLAKEEKWENLISLMDEQAGSVEFDAKQLFIRALAAYASNQYFEAYNIAVKAFELDSDLAEAAEFLAALCVQSGKTKESYFYRKLLSALSPNQDLQSVIPPNFIPDYTELLSQIVDKPLLRKGNDFESRQQWDEAEHWYQQHIAFMPHEKDGYLAIARVLISQERFRAASDALKGARAIFPEDETIASLMGDILTSLGEFEAAKACYDWAMEVAPYDEKVHGRKIRGMLSDPNSDFETCLTEFQTWQEKHVQEIKGAMPPATYGPRDQIRVGFLVRGLDRSRIAPAIGSLLAWHDQNRFHFIGYGEGEVSYPFNRYFKSAFENWRDILTTDAMTLRNMIVADQIDILIDLGGITSTETMKCFGSRIAPIQMLWASNNLSGSLSEIDFILSDRCQEIFQDKHVKMASSSVFSACRELLDENLKRDDERLAFGVDADFSELSFQNISIWARLLIANPQAILLLRSHDFFAQDNSRKLLEIFGIFGIAHRIDIIEEADRRYFFAQCDVVLLSSNSTKAETVLDALSARKPVIGCSLYDEHLSKGIDLIAALGLGNELIADDLSTFVSLGSNWLIDTEKRKSFANQCTELLSRNDFFNDKKRMEHFASVLEEVWQKADTKD